MWVYHYLCSTRKQPPKEVKSSLTGCRPVTQDVVNDSRKLPFGNESGEPCARR